MQRFINRYLLPMLLGLLITDVFTPVTMEFQVFSMFLMMFGLIVYILFSTDSNWSIDEDVHRAAKKFSNIEPNDRYMYYSINVLQLTEVGDYEAQNFKLTQMYNLSTTVHFSTKPPILVSCCYGQLFSQI